MRVLVFCFIKHGKRTNLACDKMNEYEGEERRASKYWRTTITQTLLWTLAKSASATNECAPVGICFGFHWPAAPPEISQLVSPNWNNHWMGRYGQQLKENEEAAKWVWRWQMRKVYKRQTKMEFPSRSIETSRIELIIMSSPSVF